MSSNGSRPRRPSSRPQIPRSLRLSIAVLAFVLLAVALAAPIVLHGGGSGEKACTSTLVYRGRRYVARPVPSAQVVQAIAIGVGLARGCDAPPSNVDLRSLTGIKPTAAVGLAGDQSSSTFVVGCAWPPPRGSSCDVFEAAALARDGPRATALKPRRTRHPLGREAPFSRGRRSRDRRCCHRPSDRQRRCRPVHLGSRKGRTRRQALQPRLGIPRKTRMGQSALASEQ